MRVLATDFGLTSDEWGFLGLMFSALIITLTPLYFSSWRNRRDTKHVRHEVTGNGGVSGPNEPTVKDYAKAAYEEAVDARLVADRAAITAAQVARRLTDHLEAADIERGTFLRRLDDIDKHLTDATSEVVAKVAESGST